MTSSGMYDGRYMALKKPVVSKQTSRSLLGPIKNVSDISNVINGYIPSFAW